MPLTRRDVVNVNSRRAGSGLARAGSGPIGSGPDRTGHAPRPPIWPLWAWHGLGSSGSFSRFLGLARHAVPLPVGRRVVSVWPCSWWYVTFPGARPVQMGGRAAAPPVPARCYVSSLCPNQGHEVSWLPWVEGVERGSGGGGNRGQPGHSPALPRPARMTPVTACSCYTSCQGSCRRPTGQQASGGRRRAYGGRGARPCASTGWRNWGGGGQEVWQPRRGEGLASGAGEHGRVPGDRPAWFGPGSVPWRRPSPEDWERGLGPRVW